MFLIYSLLYTLAFVVLFPRFLFDAIFNGKYAAGFAQRLGFLPKFNSSGKRIIWLHCVSVGETNAARPLAIKIKENFPDISLVISTTTQTGQKLAQTAFADIADLVFYFPFDWRSTVRRSLKHIKPTAVLLMETEIWFNVIRESHHAGARLAIVNGRLSERSANRYGKIPSFMRRVLGYLDLALMQENADASRLMSLGIPANKVHVTGNLKFDHVLDANETALTGELRQRFGITANAPLIIAASTHAPEESWILEAFKELRKTSGENSPRLMIAPRHPERFAEVAGTIKSSGFSHCSRLEIQSGDDKDVEVILLDSIGELRAAYPLAEIVFVGGSLIPHGGQSIFEPAAAGRAIITGPYTANFDAAVKEFLDKDGIVQLPLIADSEIVSKLTTAFKELLSNPQRRKVLGTNALSTIDNNRGAVIKTLEYLAPLLERHENQ